MKKNILNIILMVIMLALVSGFISFLSVSKDFASSEDMYYSYFLSSHAKAVNLNVEQSHGMEPGATIMKNRDIGKLGNNFSLIKNIVMTDNKNMVSLRGIYSAGDTYEPPILWDRYFTPEEFESDSYIAVVGKTVFESLTPEADGSCIFTFRGIDYDVIGCSGTDYESNLNNLVFIPLYTAMRNEPADGSYFIDAKTEENARAVTEAFMNYIVFDSEFSGILNPVYTVPSNTKRFLSDSVELVFLLAVLLIILNTITVCSQYTNKLRYTMAIKKMLGVSAVYAVSEELLRFWAIATAGYVFGSVLIMPLVYKVMDMIQHNVYLRLNVSNLLIAYGLTLLFFTVITVPFVIKIYKTDTSVELKGKE